MGVHKGSRIVDVDGVRVSVKRRLCTRDEMRVYNKLAKAGAPFMLKHTLTDDVLERHNISKLSFADLLLLVEENRLKELHDAIPIKLPGFPTCRNGRIEHSHCLECRIWLFEVGRFLNSIYFNCIDFVKVASRHFDFVLTPDNVDLNGILDFEHYRYGASRNKFTVIMAPFLDMFWRLYAHLGMYFIAQPMYSGKEFSLKEYLESSVDHIRAANGLTRISYERFMELFMVEEYLGFRPKQNLKGFFSEITFKFCVEQVPGAHVVPISEKYMSVREAMQSVDHFIYVAVEFDEVDDYYFELMTLDKCREVHTLILNHPMTEVYQVEQQRYALNIMFNSFYDCNVNISHFKPIGGELVTYPIVGELVDTPIEGCCLDGDRAALLDYGRANAAHRCLGEREPMEPKNCLNTLDTRLFCYGSFDRENPSNYTSKPRLKVETFLNNDFINFAAERNFKLLPGGFKQDDFSAGTSGTFSSDYLYTMPTVEKIREDFDLYNDYSDASFSPTLMLLAMANMRFLYHKIYKSDNQLAIVRDPVTVPIRNPHRSPGTPFSKIGDAAIMREIVGFDGMTAMVKHACHSLYKCLTTVQNKVAISIKTRCRTVSTNSFAMTVVGRSLYRVALDKIKASIEYGAILIGINPFNSGWDRLVRTLKIENFNNLDKFEPKLSSLDFPKFDRRSNNNTQLLSRSICFFMADPLANELNGFKVDELHHAFLSEHVNVIFDTVCFDNKLYQKTNGITSGSASTADSNSASHLMLSGYAFMDEFLRVDNKNNRFHSDTRTQLARLAFKTPAQLLSSESNPINGKWDIFDYLRRHVFLSRVLSDDGLTAYDDRVIDFSVAVSVLYMLSKYMVDNTKYSIVKQGSCPGEFLSQHTVMIAGKYYPQPVFGRIYGASVETVKDTLYQTKVDAARMVALYILLFTYRFTGTVEEKRFLDLLKQYICKKSEVVEMKFLQGVDLLGHIPLYEDVSTIDIDGYCKRVYGMDNYAESKMANPNVKHSKAVTRVLRHRVHELKIPLYKGGYVRIEDLQRAIGVRLDLNDLRELEKQDPKNRIQIKGAFIRATNGHTINIPDPDDLLVPKKGLKNVYHYTDASFVPMILSLGLKRMNRNEIHMIEDLTEQKHVPGKKDGSKTPLQIDVPLAESLGVVFYQTPNGVIVTQGNQDGIIPSVCIKVVGVNNIYNEGIKYACFCCNTSTGFQCADCKYHFCNGQFESHIVAHLKLSGHRRINLDGTLLKCAVKNCRECDYKLIMFEGTRFLCIKHADSRYSKFYVDGSIAAYKTSGSLIMGKYLDDALGVCTNMLQMRCYEAIKLGYRCALAGYLRPYHFAYFQMTDTNQRVKTSTLVVVNFDLVSEQPVIITTKERFDSHWVYYANYNDKSVVIKPKVIAYQNGLYTWELDCIENPNSITSSPVDYLSAYLTRMSEPISENLSNFFKVAPVVNDAPTRELKMIAMMSTNKFSFVHGPPGTGKSTLIANVVKILADRGCSVAIIAPSHQAVDVVCNKIYDVGCTNVVRIVTEGVKDQEIRVRKEVNRKECIDNHVDVFCCTLRAYALSNRRRSVDYVIVDEVSMASDNDLLLIINNCRESKVVFCGDPHQLSCVDDYRVGMDTHVYSNAACYIMYVRPDNVMFLKEHYRSCRAISSYISEKFYNGKLEHLGPDIVHPRFKDRGVLFLRVDNPTFAKENLSEADIILRFLLNYNVTNPACNAVAIYCAYRDQLELVRRYLKESLVERGIVLPFNYSVDTIDSGQGSEADIVIISLSRAIRFTADRNRLNVAISRAKCLALLLVPKGLHYYVPDLLDAGNYVTDYELSGIVAEKMEVAKQSKPVVNSPCKMDLKVRELPRVPVVDVISPFREDIFAFDAEWLSMRANPKVHALSAYGCVSEHEILLDCGAPSVPTKDGEVNVPPKRSNFYLPDKPWAEVPRRTLLKCMASSSNRVDLSKMVEFIANQHVAMPTLVLWSGYNDMAYLSDFIRKVELCSVRDCEFVPIFSSNAHFYCGKHIEDHTLDGLCNLQIVNITIDHEGYFCINVDSSKQRCGTNLTAAHEKYGCGKSHGEAHDPSVDALMTRCLFMKYYESIYLAYPELFELPNLCNVNRVQIGSVKHLLMKQFFRKVSYDLCEMGGGYNPLPMKNSAGYKSHNVDVINGEDMNFHICSSPVELYIDSYYYRKAKPAKPAFVLYNSDARNYLKHVNGTLVCKTSKRFNYTQDSLLDLSCEVTAWEFFLPSCSNTRGTTVFSGNIYDVPCRNKMLADGNGYFLCTNHSQNYSKLQAIRILQDHGYNFVLLNSEKYSACIKPEVVTFKNVILLRFHYLLNVIRDVCSSNKIFRPRILITTDKSAASKVTDIMVCATYVYTSKISVHSFSESAKVDFKGPLPEDMRYDVVIAEYYNFEIGLSKLFDSVKEHFPTVLIIRVFGIAPDNFFPGVYKYVQQVPMPVNKRQECKWFIMSNYSLNVSTVFSEIVKNIVFAPPV